MAGSTAKSVVKCNKSINLTKCSKKTIKDSIKKIIDYTVKSTSCVTELTLEHVISEHQNKTYTVIVEEENIIINDKKTY